MIDIIREPTFIWITQLLNICEYR